MINDEWAIRRIVENGFLMGSMTGPIDKNPLVGFDIIIRQIYSIGSKIKYMKGMILQKMIINSMNQAFRNIKIEIKEPKMKFELSLYR